VLNIGRHVSETAQSGAHISVNPSDGGGAELVISGRLDASTLLSVWGAAVEGVRSASSGPVRVDLSKLEYCDGAGLGLFAELRRVVLLGGGDLAFIGVHGDLKPLMSLAELADPVGEKRNPPPRSGFVGLVGEGSGRILGEVYDILAGVGDLTKALLWAVTHPQKVRYRDVLLIAEKAGADAVPVVCLLGGLIGLIIAYQAYEPMAQFGAQSMIPQLVSMIMVRELGPLITAILLAGRSGSAFAAEIGTMKVTEELSALETFGLSPVQFLVVPRVLAAIIVTPLLSLFATLVGVLGGYVVMASMGYTFRFYIDAATSMPDSIDLLQGVFKTGVFALLIAAIGCHYGMQTKSGPGAVGDSTTKSVVAGIVLVVSADGILGMVFHYLGI
jgi:phospholipid/cholesterol/gamma-HCH transport system permease protein